MPISRTVIVHHVSFSNLSNFSHSVGVAVVQRTFSADVHFNDSKVGLYDRSLPIFSHRIRFWGGLSFIKASLSFSLKFAHSHCIA